MRKLWQFHGGIHPDERKSLSNQSPITQAGIPEKLYIPLQQHIGAPAKALVSIGDTVLKGQKIAEAQGKISVSIHASSSGKVVDISNHPVPHPSGMLDLCIVIETDGKDRWCELETCDDYSTLQPAQLLEKIRFAGIAGMGGAGFPTEVKLHPPRQSKVNTLILNGAECEPYITSDDVLMRERAQEIILGMEIMAYILEPGECIIAVEDNKPEAIAALKTAAALTRIEIVTIPTKYPSGGEKQLIKILTGKEVPSGHIPADIGVMCQNVATARAVYRAIRFGEPLISRITTLTGLQVQQPGNTEVLIGTPVRWLLEKAGYAARKQSRVIMGGPMMGFTLGNLDVPVVKTTNCLLAADAKELPLPPPAQACIRCGMCEQACPADLLPQQLYWFSRAEEFEKAEQHHLADCIECGACSFVCPSAIPLVQHYRYAKGKIREQKLEQEKSNNARLRFESRQARIEREAAEKEAKRKERAEAAALAQAAKRAESATDASEPASREDKSALVQAALRRVEAKQNQQAIANGSAEPVDIEALKKKLLRAQDKFEKMTAALDSARTSEPDRVDALAKATQASREALEKLKAELLAHPQNNEGSTPEGPALEELESNLSKAQGKLALMLKTLEDARINKPETVEKLERAVEKNQERVDAAKHALEHALSSSRTSEASSDKNDTTAVKDIT